MKFNILLLGAALSILSIGCEKKMDRIFEESPTERLNASVSSAYSGLQSNKDGWLMKYFPSSTREFGGYTFFTKFSSVVDVTVESDFLTTAAQTSTYSVKPGPGPILSFDTYNSIMHFLSLPGYYTGIGATDSGTKGEFEFLVKSVSPDSIVLEGRKTYNKVVMVPIKSSEAATIVQSYKAAVAKFHPFGGYKFEVGTETINATFGNNTMKRALLAAGNSVYFSYRYTPSGLEFYEEYEFKGVKFKELKYVEPTGTYTKGYFTNDAGTIKLVPTT